ncbi:hypothetical protein [Methylocystis sp. S23]
MAKGKDRVIWCDRSFFPVYFGFCPNEAAWVREMRRLGVKSEPYPSSDGKVTFFECKGDVAAIVTLSKKDRWHSKDAVFGLIAHEAVHVWQKIRDEMGEDNPSPEFEAYSIQHIFIHLADAYAKTRARQKKNR